MGVPSRGDGVHLRHRHTERCWRVRVSHAREGVRGMRRGFRTRGRPRVHRGDKSGGTPGAIGDVERNRDERGDIAWIRGGVGIRGRRRGGGLEAHVRIGCDTAMRRHLRLGE